MAHLFVCQGRDDKPRWREAFPDLRLLSAEEAECRAGARDLVWIMTTLAGWSSLVGRLRASGASLVVMSYAPDPREAMQALEAGARGYVHALSPPDLLREVALVTTHRGIWVPQELLAQVVGNAFRALGGEERVPDDALSVLTERERTVALAVAQGLSNKEVARQFGITERTVKAHLGAVFRKLDVRDRMQLVLRLSHRQDATTPLS